MRLRVLYPFVGDTVGGSHMSSLGLIKALPRDEVEPVVALHQDGPLADYLSEQGIAFEWSPSVALSSAGTIVAQTAAILRATPILAGYLRSRGIDIVHTNDLRMHRTWGLAAKLSGSRFIWYQRSADCSRRLVAYSWLADRVLTVSQFCKAQLPGAMGRRAMVITSPFDPPSPRLNHAAERQRLLRELGKPGDVSVVGFVGNLTHQKRPLVFVDMAARLCRQWRRPIVFPMFGEPRNPMRRHVERAIAEQGLSDVCFLMGTRYPIEPWIAACNLIVAPGVGEAFGRALVESTFVGTPIVAADDGGNPEIIAHGETGLLVAADDAEAYADTVALLLDHPVRAAQFAERARSSSLSRFSRDRHVQTVLSLYAELTEERGAQSFRPPSH